MENVLERQDENKMGIMPVNKLLITMSVPMIISMLVQALYNIVDSIFVAQINENALTAVSLAFPVQSFMIAIVNGTGVGINALLSKSLGERNTEKASKAANNGIFLGLLSCIVFIVFGFFGVQPFFKSQTGISEIIKYGREYLGICTGFSFALIGQLTFERLLQSTGKTIYTMVTQSSGAIVNIILDPILIFGYFGFPKMGVTGAAVATVIGQTTAMMLAIYFNISKNHEIILSFRDFRPDGEVIKEIYYVGIPSIIMMTIGSLMNYSINKILMGFTATATAVFGVYFKLQSFVFMPVFGLNNGMVPIISYNFGAKKKERITETIKLSVLYAVCIMLIGLTVFQLFPDKLLLLFNASDDMLTIGVPALRTISFSFLFAGYCIVIMSVFQALGNGMMSLIVSIIRQLIVLLPAAYLLSRTGSLNAVWWAFPIAEVSALIFCSIFIKYIYDHKIKTLGE
ncbi:MATE family efflux transporter [Calorimonas adulescens]|uniref:Probable multidrug resistance protein NorM n=1 Tax=Calorimonas adulescens TaxID=2606906 RepID=A0A5D8QID7_9THEO|nr:MATE family efflux transporter [Calorimonas adulescens]TZE83626.1 MATE family efflux transporter [Calorimonas adulescens]